MNQDEPMLCDLDRRGETAMLERVTVSVVTHMHVKESNHTHMQCIYGINVTARTCSISTYRTNWL